MQQNRMHRNQYQQQQQTGDFQPRGPGGANSNYGSRPMMQQQQQNPRMQQPQQQQQHQGGGQQQPGSGQNQQQPLNLRAILTRDEVNFLFGFDGVLLNQLRQETGAHIILTEPVTFEQVLTLNGPLDIVLKAFGLICRKLWNFVIDIASKHGGQRPLILRLAVPASQCGSIIGKHGAKVKEIRNMTNTTIQVSQDTLPDSTERTVEVSGNGEDCLQSVYHISCVLQDTPIRGDHTPYMPKSVLGASGGGGGSGGGNSMPHPNQQGQPMMPPHHGHDNYKPVFLCGEKAYVIDGDWAVPAHPELLQQAYFNK